jgi:hypothetical protein
MPVTDDEQPPPPAPAPSAADLSPLLTGLLSQATDPVSALRAYQQSMASQSDQTPVSRSWTSLLGNALGGAPSGMVNLTPQQREMEGSRQLLNFGVNMLMNSGPSPVRHGLGQIIGSGLQAAGEAGQSYEDRINAYQQQQMKNAMDLQAMRINAIKEALPLLQLQTRLNMPSLYGGAQGTPGGGPVAGAATGAPISGGTYEGAIAGHEGTGANPNSSASGIGQFLAPTWNAFAAANPDLFKGMSPDQILAKRSDPNLGAQAITWLAQQNAPTLAKAGVTPSGQSLGIAHYLGAGPAAQIMQAPDGDPVSKYVGSAAVKANPELGTMTVADMKRRYAAMPQPAFLGGSGTAAVPAPYKVAGPVVAPPTVPPGAATGPPGTALPLPPIPPATVPPAASTAPPGGDLVGPRPLPLVTSRSPVVTPAQIANTPYIPGQPTPPAQGTVAPPAVPPASTTTPAPAVTTPPPPGPLSKNPDGTFTIPDEKLPSVLDYRQRYQHIITPQEMQQFGLVLPDNPQALQDKFQATQNAQREVAAAHAVADSIIHAGIGGPDADRAIQAANTADKNLQDANNTYTSLIQGANEKNTAALKDYYDKQNAALDNSFEKIREGQRQTGLETQKGQQAIALEQAKARLEPEIQLQKDMNDSEGVAKSALDQLDMARSLSRSAGDPGFWQYLQQNHPDMAQWLANIGVPNQAAVEKMGQTNAMDAAFQKLISMARTGSGFQRMTNLDVQILTSQAPDAASAQSWREAKMAYLQTLMQRQLDYVHDVRALHSQGVGLYDAQQQVQNKQGPMVPQMNAATAADPEKRKAFAAALPNNTFFRDPEGKVHIWPPPPSQTQAAPPQTQQPVLPWTAQPMAIPQ